jgi:hypothetical protein
MLEQGRLAVTRCTLLRAMLALGSAAVLMGGCTSSTNGTLDGEVTLDGAALKEGVVRFVPTGGKGTTSTANISDGRFRAPLTAGEYRVEFSSPKVLSTKRKMYDTPDSPWVDDVGELIPEKYNAKSDLTVTIQAGTQAKRFELLSK